MAAAALQTLSLLFTLAGEAAGISCHQTPSPPGRPHGGHAAPALEAPRDLTPLGDKAGTRRGCCPLAGRWPCSKGTPAAQHTPAVHILLEKISLLWFQVPAKMRQKNVQNAGFAPFPLCVSQRVLQTGHFLIVSLWLSRSGMREAFILIGKQDYKLAAVL